MSNSFGKTRDLLKRTLVAAEQGERVFLVVPNEQQVVVYRSLLGNPKNVTVIAAHRAEKETKDSDDKVVVDDEVWSNHENGWNLQFKEQLGDRLVNI